MERLRPVTASVNATALKHERATLASDPPAPATPLGDRHPADGLALTGRDPQNEATLESATRGRSARDGRLFLPEATESGDGGLYDNRELTLTDHPVPRNRRPR